MNAPCFKCANRCLGCHGKCSAYAAYHAKRELKIAENAKYQQEQSVSVESVLANKAKRHHSISYVMSKAMTRMAV